MVFRQRKQPTPHFKLPPPYQPMTGDRAQLMVPGIFPYCAMMQIAAEDTHCDYVVCRGYDPRDRKYYDYDGGDQPGIAVAKPYGNRRVGVYRIGEVYPAVLPLSAGAEQDGKIVPRIGQNPGRAEGAECQGHPTSLDDEIVHIQDEGDVYISWMLLGDGPSPLVELMLAENHPGKGIVYKCYKSIWCPQDNAYRYNCDDTCDDWVFAVDFREDVPQPVIGARGMYIAMPSVEHGTIYINLSMDCTSPGTCAAQDIDQPCPAESSTNYGGAC